MRTRYDDPRQFWKTISPFRGIGKWVVEDGRFVVVGLRVQACFNTFGTRVLQ